MIINAAGSAAVFVRIFSILRRRGAASRRCRPKDLPGVSRRRELPAVEHELAVGDHVGLAADVQVLRDEELPVQLGALGDLDPLARGRAAERVLGREQDAVGHLVAHGYGEPRVAPDGVGGVVVAAAKELVPRAAAHEARRSRLRGLSEDLRRISSCCKHSSAPS